MSEHDAQRRRDARGPDITGVVALVAVFCLAIAVPQARAQAPVGASGSTDVAAAADAAALESAAEVEAFDVWEYRVLGNEVLPALDVERALYGQLGPGKSIADVQMAREALETAYRDAGFNTVFVDIPEQTVDGGIVRLQVTEGRLDRLRVTGARYFSNRRILAAVPALESGTVPHFPTLQEELAALNRTSADRAVTPVLRAGRYPGTVDVELRVEDSLPLHGSFEVNDRYTADTTKLRSSLTLGYENLWQSSHTASLQYQVAPEEPDESEVLAATYVARLDRARSIMALYFVDSSSDVATIGALSVLGGGNIFGVRGIRPLDAIGNYFHNATFGIDLKDFDENIKLSEDDGLVTAIKYVGWSANYAFGWNLERSMSNLAIGASWGVRGFGNDDAEFEEKRFKARANYAYLFGSAQHSREVLGTARFLVRGDWQYASAPLISNEQFSAGGALSVRGYLEAEVLGDSGASLSLELHTPSLVRHRGIDDLHVLGFLDAASLSIEEPLPGQQTRAHLSSAGVGIRFRGAGGLLTDIDWARVLREGAHVVSGEERLHFSVSYTF